jgi:tRNA A-37 threonylcarbamoyl transferase component Bud32
VHNAGYVHGDIRTSNILVYKNSPMLIDFDWAGNKGVVRYPINMNIDAKQWEECMLCSAIY